MSSHKKVDAQKGCEGKREKSVQGKRKVKWQDFGNMLRSACFVTFVTNRQKNGMIYHAIYENNIFECI